MITFRLSASRQVVRLLILWRRRSRMLFMMFVHHTGQIRCDVRFYGDVLLCYWFRCSDPPTSEAVQIKCWLDEIVSRPPFQSVLFVPPWGQFLFIYLKRMLKYQNSTAKHHVCVATVPAFTVIYCCLKNSSNTKKDPESEQSVFKPLWWCKLEKCCLRQNSFMAFWFFLPSR